MAKILNEEKLKKMIRNNELMLNGKEKNIEGIKYDFTLSSRILKAKYKSPIDMNKLSEIQKKEMVIEPGEVVFALTEEKLKLPNNIFAQICQKRKLSHDGIWTLCGACVDPLYEGHLLIGLYNFASKPYSLRPTKKLVAAVFYELEKEETMKFIRPLPVIDDFPEDIIKLMERYEPISSESIINQINSLKEDLDSIKEDVRDRKDWFDRFQNSLKDTEDLITNEIRERQKNDREFNKKLQNLWMKISGLAAAVAIIISLIVGIIIKYFNPFG